MSEATTTITEPVGETFTHSAWVQGDTDAYDVEVGPRLTFRRVRATEVNKGDHLMDAFGRPSILVTGKRVTKRVVSLSLEGGHQSFLLSEVLNVFVSSEDVAGRDEAIRKASQ